MLCYSIIIIIISGGYKRGSRSRLIQHFAIYIYINLPNITLLPVPQMDFLDPPLINENNMPSTPNINYASISVSKLKPIINLHSTDLPKCLKSL